jgi:NAD(P)-dependent dehydrogenase (short-subunit alcohol dehydrogenase family)
MRMHPSREDIMLKVARRLMTSWGFNDRSSKSALHGLIHWLAGAYAKKGITVNGVAPALIGETKMLPGGDEELAKSMYNASGLSCLDHSG